MVQNEILTLLKSCCLPEWDRLPDFGLYMDQMVGFVERLFEGIHYHEEITTSMINNYVKSGLIDRPVGKKYSRESLAQLLMVSQLKATVSVQAMTCLLHPLNKTTQEVYEQFKQDQKNICMQYESMPERSALSYALGSSACLLISHALMAEEPGSDVNPKQKVKEAKRNAKEEKSQNKEKSLND